MYIPFTCSIINNSIIFFFQWYRAKYIHRLLIRHTDLSNLKHWTPKEIVLFSRQFAYAPSLNVSQKNNLIINSGQIGNSLSSLIKNEIKKERLQESTLSYCRKVTDWIKESNLNRKPVNNKELNDMEIVNIDEIEDTRRKGASMKTMCKNLLYGKVYMPIEDNLIKEDSWITDACRDIQLELQPEEILKGLIKIKCSLLCSVQFWYFF